MIHAWTAAMVLIIFLGLFILSAVGGYKGAEAVDNWWQTRKARKLSERRRIEREADESRRLFDQAGPRPWQGRGWDR